ncbi:MAG: TlpA family protein disulfide reductase [Salinivirgaceae bacterium]|nr:TlpA family protein disulfide reductase [Salinivirgaceae bacterium]
MSKFLKHILCGAMSVGLLASCTQKSNTFVIEGFVDEAITDSAYNVFIGDTNFRVNPEKPFEVVVVKDKKFHFETQIDYPTYIYLQAIFPGDIPCQAYVNFILVPGETAKVTVHNGYFDLDGGTFYKSWRKFDEFYSESTARIKEMSRQLQGQQPLDEELYKEYVATRDSLLDKLMDYTKQHSKEEGAIIYASQCGFTSVSNLFDTIAAPEIRSGVFGRYIQQRLESEAAMLELEKTMAEREKATAVGTMFTDFAAEYNGKTTKLSDYVGKGQYVLVDFWASWCGPCRAEIPNLIKVYDKYKGKKFNVLGVTVSDRPEDSEEAISELGINYPQMLNTDDSCANLYGIMGIPHIILFGPDGTILERDLRGEAIDAAVRKHMGL